MNIYAFVLTFVLSGMTQLVPARDHAELAEAIAVEVANVEPLYDDDEDKIKTAALLVSVAFNESSLRNDAIGDRGRALCMFQLWYAPREVLTNPRLCTRIAIA